MQSQNTHEMETKVNYLKQNELQVLLKVSVWTSSIFKPVKSDGK